MARRSSDDNGIVIWDSQAIRGHLARTYDESGRWFPNYPLTLACVMQWLQMANEEVAALAWARVTVLMKQPRDRLGELQSKGRAGLCVINEQLADHSLLAGTDHLTIGDVSCLPYAGVAEQGGRILRLPACPARAQGSYRLAGIHPDARFRGLTTFRRASPAERSTGAICRRAPSVPG
ncbi:MAG: hypothetical protein P8L79_07565 [Rhodospirillaceae bacterium]|nr:hypothetical protein [Rhodospirillaceae bacterium]